MIHLSYVALGLSPDVRTYNAVRPMLERIGADVKLRLITNNPAKVDAAIRQGYEIVERIPIEVPATANTRQYLLTKKNDLGHILRQV